MLLGREWSDREVDDYCTEIAMTAQSNIESRDTTAEKDAQNRASEDAWGR